MTELKKCLLWAVFALTLAGSAQATGVESTQLKATLSPTIVSNSGTQIAASYFLPNYDGQAYVFKADTNICVKQGYTFTTTNCAYLRGKQCKTGDVVYYDECCVPSCTSKVASECKFGFGSDINDGCGNICKTCKVCDDECGNSGTKNGTKSTCDSQDKIQTSTYNTGCGTTCYVCRAKTDTCPGSSKKDCTGNYKKGTVAGTTEVGNTCYNCVLKDDNCTGNEVKSCDTNKYVCTKGKVTEAGTQCWNYRDKNCADTGGPACTGYTKCDKEKKTCVAQSCTEAGFKTECPNGETGPTITIGDATCYQSCGKCEIEAGWTDTKPKLGIGDRLVSKENDCGITIYQTANCYRDWLLSKGANYVAFNPNELIEMLDKATAGQIVVAGAEMQFPLNTTLNLKDGVKLVGPSYYDKSLVRDNGEYMAILKFGKAQTFPGYTYKISPLTFNNNNFVSDVKIEAKSYDWYQDVVKVIGKNNTLQNADILATGDISDSLQIEAEGAITLAGNVNMDGARGGIESLGGNLTITGILNIHGISYNPMSFKAPAFVDITSTAKVYVHSENTGTSAFYTGWDYTNKLFATLNLAGELIVNSKHGYNKSNCYTSSPFPSCWNSVMGISKFTMKSGALLAINTPVASTNDGTYPLSITRTSPLSIASGAKIALKPSGSGSWVRSQVTSNFSKTLGDSETLSLKSLSDFTGLKYSSASYTIKSDDFDTIYKAQKLEAAKKALPKPSACPVLACPTYFTEICADNSTGVGAACNGRYESCICPETYQYICDYPRVGYQEACGGKYKQCTCPDGWKQCYESEGKIGLGTSVCDPYNNGSYAYYERCLDTPCAQNMQEDVMALREYMQTFMEDLQMKMQNGEITDAEFYTQMEELYSGKKEMEIMQSIDQAFKTCMEGYRCSDKTDSCASQTCEARGYRSSKIVGQTCGGSTTLSGKTCFYNCKFPGSTSATCEELQKQGFDLIISVYDKNVCNGSNAPIKKCKYSDGRQGEYCDRRSQCSGGGKYCPNGANCFISCNYSEMPAGYTTKTDTYKNCYKCSGNGWCNSFTKTAYIKCN